jgi:uncharacterized protein YdhG (YjbR/CyaY superfamily)
MPSLEAYIRSIPPGRLERFLSIHEQILRLYPDIQVDMSCSMPTYRLGDGWVALANQKNYISLYTCGESHLEKYRQKHPEQKTGKGCINFRARDIIHHDDLKHVIKHAIEHAKS